MSKTSLSSLTQGELSPEEEIAQLDRKLWEELEGELSLRCPYKCRFGVHYLGIEQRPWEWLIQRCYTWEEVERVLNWHKVDWKREGQGKILTGNKLIFRCG
jgi:hypothetical protein